MNWQQLRAFAWLRWRLLANQWRRAGKFNATLMVVVSIGAAVAALPLFLGCFALGVYAIPRAQPAHLMYAWDGLIAAFLLSWTIGLVTDLQRSDPLTLSKFLHLPVSVRGAFLLNYLSSLLRLSLLLFGPIMLAYALALAYIRGLEQWAVVPLLAAFLLMVTGLTYQFQGWLALLMNNPRRRRAVVVGATMGIVLLAQLPNLIGQVFISRRHRGDDGAAAAKRAEVDAIGRELAAGTIAPAEAAERSRALGEWLAAEPARRRGEEAAWVERAVRLGNLVLPVGWLPLGVQAAARGRPAPALWGLAGMALIGVAGLGRAYRTAIRAYTGQASDRKGRAPAPRPDAGHEAGRSLLEARLPGVSEPVAAIALGTFRSLLRAPEAKMALLSPLILAAVFGSMLARGAGIVPDLARPLVGIGAIVSVLFGLLQLMGNQFGFDRDGFRAFVLCAARRRDILLGKNLAYLPVAAALAAALLAVVQVFQPMRPDHALAMVPQFVSMFLLFCIMANLFSIYAPMHNAVGSLKPAHPKLTTILLQLVLFLLLFPLGQGITLVPLGAEAAWVALGGDRRVPVCLALTVLECMAIALFYRASLGWLGDELQAREQKILEVVTNRAA